MHETGVLVLRGLAGGTLVVVFALVGEIISPKAFAGLFSAAPSVALASLAITIIFQTQSRAHQNSVGMVVGGVAMTAGCVLATVAIPRVRALWATAGAWCSWGAVGLGLYWAVFIGAH
jgi:hypothetical protein